MNPILPLNTANQSIVKKTAEIEKKLSELERLGNSLNDDLRSAITKKKATNLLSSIHKKKYDK